MTQQDVYFKQVTHAEALELWEKEEVFLLYPNGIAEGLVENKEDIVPTEHYGVERDIQDRELQMKEFLKQKYETLQRVMKCLDESGVFKKHYDCWEDLEDVSKSIGYLSCKVEL